MFSFRVCRKNSKDPWVWVFYSVWSLYGGGSVVQKIVVAGSGDLISIQNRKDSSLVGPMSMFMFAGGLITLGVLLDSIPIEVALSLGIFALIIEPIWGRQALSLALLTTGPILIVVVWLMGAIAWFGYGLNMVTVAIATMSLGVGIDYVIHVVERFREERLNGLDALPALSAVGGASGIASFSRVRSK